MRLTIDRFEEGLAVCETQELNIVRIPISYLPEGVKEGDMLNKSSNGEYTLLVLDTHQKRKELFDAQNELFKK